MDKDDMNVLWYAIKYIVISVYILDIVSLLIKYKGSTIKLYFANSDIT